MLAALLALATARGDVPQAEEGEDVDLTDLADWRTVGQARRGLRPQHRPHRLLGWAITGALLFAGTAWVLGSRAAPGSTSSIGALLSVGTWYGFYVGLGVPIPAGILDGVL